MSITETELFFEKNKLKIILFLLAFVWIVTSPLVSFICIVWTFWLFWFLAILEENDKKPKNNNFYKNKNKNK